MSMIGKHSVGRPWRGSRARVLGLGGLGAVWLLTRGRAQAASRGVLSGLTVENEGLPFAGDGPRFATVSTRAPRTTARFDFHLARRATVSVSILATGQGAASEQPSVVAETTLREQHSVAVQGTERSAGRRPPLCRRERTSPVSRPASRAFLPKQCMRSFACWESRRPSPSGVRCRALKRRSSCAPTRKTLTVQMLRSGPEAEPTYANAEIKGVPVGAPIQVDWSVHANAPAPLPVTLGADWPSGVYAARLDADDGRVGFAPLVVRPPAPQPGSRSSMPTTHLAGLQLLRRRP